MWGIQFLSLCSQRSLAQVLLAKVAAPPDIQGLRPRVTIIPLLRRLNHWVPHRPSEPCLSFPHLIRCVLCLVPKLPPFPPNTPLLQIHRITCSAYRKVFPVPRPSVFPSVTKTMSSQPPPPTVFLFPSPPCPSFLQAPPYGKPFIRLHRPCLCLRPLLQCCNPRPGPFHTLA